MENNFMNTSKRIINTLHILAALVCCLTLTQFFIPSVHAGEDENIALLDRSAKAFSSVYRQATRKKGSM